jgi:hypothetical protein
MVDLLYEIDRRVRISCGFDDYLPIGHPRIPSTDGKYPALDSPYYEALKKEKYFKINRFYKDGPLAAAKNDKAFNKMCKETPDVVFILAEAIRRNLDYWELRALKSDSLKETSTNT